MKIGLIGHGTSIEIISRQLRQKPGMAEIIPIQCLPDGADKKAQEWQDKLDGIMFTGYLPYIYASRRIVPVVPWDYFSRTTGSVLEAMVDAAFNHNLDVSKITYDLQENSNEEFLTSIMASCNIPAEEIRVKCFRPNPHEEYTTRAYNDRVFDFHLQNLRQGQARICFTGMDSVRQMVGHAGYPAFWLHPTVTGINNQMDRLIMECRMALAEKQSKNDSLVVIAVGAKLFKAPGGAGYSEFMRHHISSGMGDIMYSFAQSRGGAVEYHEGMTSLIYLQRGILLTQGGMTMLRRFMKRLAGIDGIEAVHIGIGGGMTVAQAKACAERGRVLAAGQGQTCFFIVSSDNEDETILGPFTYKKPEDTGRDTGVQKGLQTVSENTGLSIRTIRTLYEIMNEYDVDVTTVKELAQLSGMTTSNLNRVLSRLEDSGYLETVGRRNKGAGRPQKLIRIRLGD